MDEKCSSRNCKKKGSPDYSVIGEDKKKYCSIQCCLDEKIEKDIEGQDVDNFKREKLFLQYCNQYFISDKNPQRRKIQSAFNCGYDLQQSKIESLQIGLDWAEGQFAAIRAYTQDSKIAAACMEAELRIQKTK